MSELPRRHRAAPRAVLRRHRPTHLLTAAAAALTLTVGACSSDPELTASVETMVELESTLQCDITRYAHADAAAVDGYRDTVRERFAVSADDHKIFLDMMLDDEELRGQVADRADVLCPPPADEDLEEES